jgi:hypothetical protein
MVGAAGVVALTACADKSVTAPAATPRAVMIGAGDDASVPGPSAMGSPTTYPLYAGGGGSGAGTLVGFVSVYSVDTVATVSPNDYRIHATYTVYPGFCIRETHLSIQLDAAMVPQRNGNPIPGQFEQKGAGACETSVQYSKLVDLAGQDRVVIAAHAVVSGSGRWPARPSSPHGKRSATRPTGLRRCGTRPSPPTRPSTRTAAPAPRTGSGS